MFYGVHERVSFVRRLSAPSWETSSPERARSRRGGGCRRLERLKTQSVPHNLDPDGTFGDNRQVEGCWRTCADGQMWRWAAWSGHVAVLLLRRGILGSDLPSAGFCEGGDGTK